jgi:hypothetical protein
MNNVKRNGDVEFYEDGHIYVNTKNKNITYISVTSLIKDFHEPYDMDFWSGYKALEALMGENFVDVRGYLLDKKKIKFKISDYVDAELYKEKKKEIEESWVQKSKDSSEWGTNIHKQKEERFYKGGTINPKDCGFLLHDDNFSCDRDNFDLTRSKAVLPEYLVYYSNKDLSVNLAGQIDLLIKDGNDLYIYDYKTNEKGIETKPYYDKSKKQTKKMYYPINNLEDTTYIHYTMQLSIYAWMLQQINPNFNIKRLCIIHIDRAGKETEVEIDYKKEEVIKLLKTHKKNQLIKQLKNVKAS